MKLTPALVLLLSACSLAAQTSGQAPVRRTAPAVHSTPQAACVKVPELSPKIPALPPGTPCAMALYTITTPAKARLEYVSPLEGPGLADALGLGSSSFSLDYIETKVGAGELATPHKFYTIHYTGYLVDGTKFDSSLDRGEPITIPYGGHRVIAGWDTGFDGMRVGGKRRLFIPYQLAYGPQGQGPIPANAELIFDVELVAVSDTPPKPKTPPTPPSPPSSQNQPTNRITTPSPASPAPATPPSDPTKPTAVPPSAGSSATSGATTPKP